MMLTFGCPARREMGSPANPTVMPNDNTISLTDTTRVWNLGSNHTTPREPQPDDITLWSLPYEQQQGLFASGPLTNYEKPADTAYGLVPFEHHPSICGTGPLPPEQQLVGNGSLLYQQQPATKPSVFLYEPEQPLAAFEAKNSQGKGNLIESSPLPIGSTNFKAFGQC